MSTLEIVMAIILALVIPFGASITRRINRIERDYADRKEINMNMLELEKRAEKKQDEIKEVLKEMKKDHKREAEDIKHSIKDLADKVLQAK